MIEFKINLESQAAIASISGLASPARIEGMVDEASSIMISRVRRRFMQQENPDGSKWVPSKAALKRLAGGMTKGSDGKMYSGGNTYFASGNLFHSIQLVRESPFRRSIETDYYVAKYCQRSNGRIIIGAGPVDLQVIVQALVRRFTSGP
jgi:hypothetical protein